MIKSTCVAFFFFGVTFAPSASAFAQTRWSGDPECVDAQRIEGALASLRPDSATLSVSVHIERTPTSAVARVSRDSLQRVLEASNCEQLEDSLVLVLSLFPAVQDPPTLEVTIDERSENADAIDAPVPNTANDPTPDSTPDPDEEAQREATTVETTTANALTRPPAPLAAWVGVGLDVDVGSLHAPSFAPSLTLTIERKRLWFALNGVYRPSLVRAFDVGEVAMSSAHAGLSIGGYAWKSAQEQAGFLLSGGTSMGFISAESRNISQPRQGRVLHFALHADAHLHWSPWPWLRLRVHAGIGVPLVRAEFQVEGLGIAYATPNLLARAGISLELRFWSRNST